MDLAENKSWVDWPKSTKRPTFKKHNSKNDISFPQQSHKLESILYTFYFGNFPINKRI